MFLERGSDFKHFAALFTLELFDVCMVQLSVLPQVTFLTETETAFFADERFFAGVCSHVRAKYLPSGKLLFAQLALEPENVRKFDVSISQAVGPKTFGAVVARIYFVLLRNVFFKPVFLKSVLPSKRVLFFNAIVVHAKYSIIFLPHKVIYFGGGMHY